MRYWAQQAVELCSDIDDESLTESCSAVEKAVERMGEDRRVVLIGASGSGKSELLAGMVGCPVLGRISPTHHYLRWRYLNNGGDTEHCRFMPEPALAGMELVNTRGCEQPAVAEAVAPLLPGADVVVAVVDARSISASPVWEMMAPLPETGGPACLVVLTHTDALDAEHLGRVISNFVRSLPKRKRFIFISRYYVADSIDTIAKNLDLSRSMVNKELAAIRSALKEKLESEGYSV